MHISYESNLVRLGRVAINRDTNRRDKRFAERFRSRQQETILRTIKKAIHKECSAELARRAIRTYRRSATDARSGETDFLKTDQPKIKLERDHHYKRALLVTEKLFRPTRRLKPIAFPDLRYYPWTLPTSAEAPYVGSKYWQDIIRQKQADGEIEDGRTSFHNLYNEIFHENRIHVHSIKFGMAPFWDKNGNPVPYEFNTLHSRSHLVSEDKPDKIRAVFGVPKLLLMVENMFVWNLQKEYLNEKIEKGPLLWGFETIRGGWAKLRQRLSKINFNTVISADWSGFDHKALHEVIDDVHTMWRSWFDFDQGYEPSKSDDHDYSNSQTEEWKIQNLWDWMTNAIKHTPIRSESGNLYQWKFNGIASGFQQTQLLDSFVNCIYLLTALSEAGINILGKSFQALFQGDDSIVTFPEMVNHSSFLSTLSRIALRRFNAVLSTDKTTIGDDISDVEVFSYRNREGLAYRDPAELLAHLLYPERPRTEAATAAAAVGIAQAAMGSSHEVYSTCRELFSFLVEQWEVEPDYVAKDIWSDINPKRNFNWKPMTVQEFPTFEQTFLQNFDLRRRDEKAKQRLWPTLPTGNGFHFLFD
jgi:hypothetical protein